MSSLPALKKIVRDTSLTVPLDPSVIDEIERSCSKIGEDICCLIQKLHDRLVQYSEVTMKCMDLTNEATTDLCEQIDQNVTTMSQFLSLMDEIVQDIGSIDRLQFQVDNLNRIMDSLESRYGTIHKSMATIHR